MKYKLGKINDTQVITKDGKLMSINDIYKDLSSENQEDLVCPYCGTDNSILEENEYTENFKKCSKCGKTFVYWINFSSKTIEDELKGYSIGGSEYYKRELNKIIEENKK